MAFRQCVELGRVEFVGQEIFIEAGNNLKNLPLIGYFTLESCWTAISSISAIAEK